MARTIVPTDFVAEVIHGVHTMPLKGFGLAAGLGLINVAMDLLDRQFGGHYSSSEYVAIGVLTITSLSAVYWIVMMMVEATASWMGGLRYLSTLVLSIGLPLGVLFLSLWSIRNGSGGIAISIALFVLFVALFTVPLLAGWPVAQAISDHLIPPMRILKATKGYRWGLVTTSYLSTALDKIVPATDTAKSSGQAIALAIGNGAVSCASVVLLASIGATAWKFAIRTDPELAGGVSLAAS